MKRRIPGLGLYSRQQDSDRPLEGLFLVRSRVGLLSLASAEGLLATPVRRIGTASF